MAEYNFNDWSGGKSDNYIDSNPNKSKELRNLDLTRNSKVRTRPGSEYHSSNVNSLIGESRINKIDNHYVAEISAERLLMVSANRLFLEGSGQYSGPAPASISPVFENQNTFSQISTAKWRRHLFMTCSDPFNDSYSNHVIKLYSNPATFGSGPVMRMAGLPRANRPNTGGVDYVSYANAGLYPNWSSVTVYAIGDKVQYISAEKRITAVYVSLVAGNTNNQPNTNPDKWALFFIDVVTFHNHYAAEYVVEGVTYVDFGPTSFWTLYVPATFGTDPTSLSVSYNITPYTQFNYLKNMPNPADVAIFYYRTEVNGVTAKFEKQILVSAYAGPTYVTKKDIELGLIYNEPRFPSSNIYTTGGRFDNDTPPECRYLTSANDMVWYGFLRYWEPDNALNITIQKRIFPSRVVHSIQGDGDAVPKSFFVDIDDTISGMGSVDIYPVVYSRTKTYRIEGFTDAYGRGAAVKRLVSETVGCISNNSIVKSEDGRLYFAAVDGFYYTDGFRVTKISDDLNDTYAEISGRNNPVIADRTKQELQIHGTLEPITNRVFWTVRGRTSHTDNTLIIIYDPYHEQNGSKAFTTWSGGDFDSPTTAYDGVWDKWIASAVTFNNAGNLIRATDKGITLQHKKDLVADYWYDAATVNFLDVRNMFVPICWEWTSHATSFGVKTLRKWVTMLTVICKRITASLTFTPYSINDNRESNIKRYRAVELDASSSDKLHYAKRRSPRNSLRCLYRQIQFKNDPRIAKKSDVLGTAVVNGVGNTAVIGSNGFDYTDFYGFMYFEFDNYTTGYRIISPISRILYPTATLTLEDLGNTLQSGTWKWVLKKIIHNDIFEPEHVTVEYEEFSDSLPGTDGTTVTGNG